MEEIIEIGKAYNKQQAEAYKHKRMLNTVLAYEIAAMQRAKRLPNLQDLLQRIDTADEKIELSPEELLQKIISISACNGWSVEK